MYSSMAAQIELRGGNIQNLKGSGIADPVRSKLVYGLLSWPTYIERRILMDHIEFCLENTPKWKPFAPNGVDPNQAGMNAVHELGAALGSAIAVLEDLKERGHSIDEYGAMVFALDSDSDFLKPSPNSGARGGCGRKSRRSASGQLQRRQCSSNSAPGLQVSPSSDRSP